MTLKHKIAYGPGKVKDYFDLDQHTLDLAENARLVLERREAREVIAALPRECAIDFETTGLSPLTGAEVRLTCLYSPLSGAVILDHKFCGSFDALVQDLVRDRVFYCYNAKFETLFIDYFAGHQNTEIWDVDFYAKAKLGGHPSSFARMCKRDLSIDISKDLQTSDWTTIKLTKSQYAYGARDAILTWYLKEFWDAELSDEQWEAVKIFNDAVRGTIECEQVGLVLDKDTHQRNIDLWRLKHSVALATVRRYTPNTVISNLRSNKQVSDYLKANLGAATLREWPKTGKLGYLSLERKVLKPIQQTAPWPFSRWLIAFMQMRYYEKYLSTYGETLLNIQRMAGRVRSRFNIAQAATGRYSSSSVNLQNIPRKQVVREVFETDSRLGRCLVMADYSGIELRVLAEISGDEQLKHDVIYGNVHASSAATIYRIPEDKFLAIYNDKTHPLQKDYKEKRSVAKGFSFQLTYGAAAPALSVVLKSTVDEAHDAINAWARRYPKAYDYRRRIFDVMQNTGFIPVVDGRTIYVRKADRTMPVAANYGIQGAAASVMYRAVYHVHRLYKERLKDRYARLCATVHDELLTSVDKACAPLAGELLVQGMLRGWLDIFPGSSTDNLVNDDNTAVIGSTWADKP